MKHFNEILVAGLIAGASLQLAPANAQNSEHAAHAAQASGNFVKKQKAISGGWAIEQLDGRTVIVFADNFKANSGPDLKVFLSPQTVADVTGKTAVNGSLLLGELKSTKGRQVYVLPEGVNLSDYSSVLVHCEEYAVLWGGGDL